MTAKDLIEKLSRVDPDTEIIGGMFNGRTNTYTVLDELHVFPKVLRQHRSKEWKKERIYQLLTDFDVSNSSVTTAKM